VLATVVTGEASTSTNIADSDPQLANKTIIASSPDLSLISISTERVRCPSLDRLPSLAPGYYE